MSGFNYNGENIPRGGAEGEILVKIANADYYVQYRSLTEVFQEYEFEIDEGEY
jgi:hypothetical protein